MYWRKDSRFFLSPVRKWNFPSTPTFYIIHPAGVIRYKWVMHPGEKTIDGALEKLLREAEGRPEPSARGVPGARSLRSDP